MSHLATLASKAFASAATTTFLLLIFVAALVYLLRSRSKTGQSSSSVGGQTHPLPPGPWGVPLLGNLLQLTQKPHRKLTEYWRHYGDVYKIQMGSRPAVILNGFDTVWKACVKQADDFAGRPDFYTFKLIANGNSMGFGDYGRRWRMHRKIAQNALNTFVNKKVNPIDDVISAEADVLVSQLVKKGKKPLNPHNEIYLSVGNIICAICFGKHYQRDDPDFVRLVELNDQFMAYAAAGNPVDILPWTRRLLTRSLNNFVGILNIMDEFCAKKRREHLDTYQPDVMRDVTDILIRTMRETPEEDKEAVGLTDEHILTTVQELIGAGFDTISSTLQWSVLFLMTNPEVQDRAHEEIKRVVGMDRNPRLDDVSSLPYTEAVLLEVMRHSSLFPLALPHSTTRDTVLNGYFIPANTMVLVNLWSVVRDERAFPDPERFDPQRFLDSQGNIKRDMADKFLPYGAGRRRCPGEPLARMELFQFTATLIQRCRFVVPPGTSPVVDSKYGLTLKPQDFTTLVEARE